MDDKTCFVNYEAEYQAFQCLLSESCEQRILLFEGKANMGKTHLLGRCVANIPKKYPYVLIDSSHAHKDLFGILLHLSTHFTKKQVALPRFTQELEKLTGQSQSDIDLKNVAQWGSGNQILASSTSGGGAHTLSRQDWLNVLSHLWFQDMQAVSQVCLVIIDAFQEASPALCEWLNGDFLPEVAYSENLRVVIAGRQVPEINLSWVNSQQKCVLNGVIRASDWLPIAKQQKRHIPAEHPTDYLQGACDALCGNPKAMIKFIEELSPEWS